MSRYGSADSACFSIVRAYLEASDFFTMNSRETRGHGMKIMKQPSRLNLRKFSFSHRVVDDWNSLPSKVVEARELDEAWKDIRFLHTAL